VTLDLTAPVQHGRADWPNALYELTQAVAAATEPDEIFVAALDCLEHSLGVSRSSLLLFDSVGVMRFRAWRGLSDGYRRAVEGHSPWTPETSNPQPVLVKDVRLDASLDALRPTIEGEGFRALAFVPLVLGGRLLGKFMLYYSEPHVFDEHELLIARTIAAHAAFAIDQQEHRESELRYRQLIDAVGVAVYTTDAHGRISFYNEEAANLWGRRPRIGEDMWCGSWRLFWPDGTPIAHEECPMAVTLKTGRPSRGMDAVAERPDGSRVHFIPYPTPLFDAEGRMCGAVNVLVDITTLKRTEAALAEKEEGLARALTERDQVLRARDETIYVHEQLQAKLASLIEASSALIGSTPGNDAVAAILNIARGLLGADAYAVWRFVDARDQWEMLLSNGLSANYLQGGPIRAENGMRHLDMEIIEEDVLQSERLADRRRAYEEEGIRSLFVVPLPVGLRENGTLTFYYREKHAFSDLELRVGRSLANLASASLMTAGLLEENQLARADAEQIAEELRLANDAKDAFLGLVSHELRTPLTIIRGNAGVLSSYRDRLDAAARDEALADIVQESERLHRIIENLLLLARAEQGVAPEAEPLLLIRVARRVVERHQQRYPARKFEIVEHQEPRPVVFQEASLEQVIENLITNAEKYSPSTEPIVIDVERLPSEVRIRVIDRGPGLSQDADRLFEPFYRSAGSSRRAEGLGIGLAVCKRLVEAQGGRIWAKNRPEGGSEFGFALPLVDDPAHEF
jgi:PAS domain S-box-containing protein